MEGINNSIEKKDTLESMRIKETFLVGKKISGTETVTKIYLRGDGKYVCEIEQYGSMGEGLSMHMCPLDLLEEKQIEGTPEDYKKNQMEGNKNIKELKELFIESK